MRTVALVVLSAACGLEPSSIPAAATGDSDSDVATSTCGPAPVLPLEPGTPKVLTGRLPSSGRGQIAGACNVSGAVDAFYRPSFVGPHHLQATVAGGGDLLVTMHKDACQDLPGPIIGCSDSLSVYAPSDRWLLAISGPPDEPYTLTISADPVDPATCEQATVLGLSAGSAEVVAARDLAIEMDAGSGITDAWLLYRFELSDAADLEIDKGYPSEQAFILRQGGCGGAELVSYSDLSGDGFYVANLPADTYYLFAAGGTYEDIVFTFHVSLFPPTPRPSNDRCDGALALDLSAGSAEATGGSGSHPEQRGELMS